MVFLLVININIVTMRVFLLTTQSCRIGVREGQGGWLSRIHPTDRPTHYRPQIPDLSNAPLQTVQNPSLHYILFNFYNTCCTICIC